MMFYKYNIENLLALPMFTSEIFSITYENIVSCPDERCISFQKGILENKINIHKLENLNTETLFPEIEIIGKYRELNFYR